MRSLASWLAPLLVVGCSAHDAGGPVEADASSSPLIEEARAGAGPSVPRALAIAERAMAKEAVSSILAPGRALTKDGEGISSPGFRAPRAHVLGDLGLRLGDHANDVARIGLGQSAVDRLDLSLIGAANVAARVHEGRVVYENAYPETDVVWAADSLRAELFYVLHAPAKKASFQLRIERESGIARVERDGLSGLRFVDDKGATVFTMPAPFAVDADGTRRAVSLAYDDPTVTLTLDTEGLVAPIVIDPALEVFRWKKLGLTGPPSARKTHAMAFDAGRGKTVLFGGSGYSCDTWTFTDDAAGTWVNNITAAACLSSGPVGRQAHAMVNDLERNVVFLFGGFDGGFRNDTWVWQGTSWSQVCTTAPCTTTRPTGRSSASMAYDSARKVTVMFGGYDAGGLTCDTWEWNGSTWALRLAGTGCGTGRPEARSNSAMAYDVSRGVTVLYGGYAGASAGDTWEWNGALGTWTKKPATGPSARQDHVMAYDSARARTILFSGSDSAGLTNDVWEYDGATWQDRTPTTTKPSYRDQSAAAYDSLTRRFIVFGGSANTVPVGGGLVNNETWEYSTYGGACSLASQCDTGKCEDGVCCQTTCAACQRCDDAASPGSCLPIKSAEDTAGTTCSGASYCDSTGACTVKTAKGGACTLGSACATGSCVDGVCCDAACTGSCKSCLAADTGLAQGTCGSVQNGKKRSSSGAPQCTGTAVASCGLDGFCDGAGACRNWAAGSVCLAGTCPTPTSVKVQQTCGGSGAACATSTEMACTVGFACIAGVCKTACTAETDCATGYYCATGGVCTAKKTGATACGGAKECSSNFCVDGVCCNAACAGLCSACSAAKKGSGLDGTCGTIADGADPDNECAAPSMFACNYGASGGDTCDGAGKCRQYAKVGTACAADSTCTAGKQTGQSCDGSGNCIASGDVFCAPYQCDSAGKVCRKTCDGDGDCSDATYYCSSVKLCEKRKANGTTCAVAGECSSGSCVDTVCCDTACAGQCEACNEAGKVGTCSAVTGDPRPARASCVGDGSCKGSCDGTTRSACVVPVGKECGNVCTEGKATISRCDAAGACAAEAAKVCPNGYSCSTDGTCRSSCSTGSDCITGYSCEGTECRPIGSKCSDDLAEAIAPDGKRSACGPYLCKTGGCGSTCAVSDTDCAAGYLCDGNKCVPQAPGSDDSDDSGGCGCHTATRPSSAPFALAGLAALIALSRRRR